MRWPDGELAGVFEGVFQNQLLAWAVGAEEGWSGYTGTTQRRAPELRSFGFCLFLYRVLFA